MSAVLDDPLAIVTRSDIQPTPEDRLGEFKRKAVNVPELNHVIGNLFFKQFFEADHA